MRFEAFPLDSEPSLVEVADPEPLSTEVEHRIDALWQEERNRRGSALYDAPLFSLIEPLGDELRGRFVPYRWWLAQNRDPALFDVLAIQPASVCALTCVDAGVVFGRRAAHVSQDPGCWETAPAGGLGPEARDPDGRLSLRTQLLAEAREELGVAPNHVRAATPFARVVDQQLHVHDFAFELRVDTPPAWPAPSHDTEYEEVRIVALEEIAAFVESEGPRISPIAPALLRARGWLA